MADSSTTQMFQEGMDTYVGGPLVNDAEMQMQQDEFESSDDSVDDDDDHNPYDPDELEDVYGDDGDVED